MGEGDNFSKSAANTLLKIRPSDWGQFNLLTRCFPSFLETGELGCADKVSASAFDDMFGDRAAVLAADLNSA